MRQIGTLSDERQARRLADYLFTLGIRSQLETESGGIVVWALDEDRIPQAREEFLQFQQYPDAERYAAAEAQAEQIRNELIQREKSRQRNIVDVRRRWLTPRMKPFTFLLIVACCAVTLASGFGDKFGTDPVSRKLVIAEFHTQGRQIEWYGLGKSWTDDPSASPPRFQFWRILTPIFLHLSLLHLVMNMMAMQNLATVIEGRRGPLPLALMTVVIGVGSNLAQYLYSGPAFGGISGVAFGLFGYLWMKSAFDPLFGIRLSNTGVYMMLGWLVLCMLGVFGDIANAAHVAGLILGMLLGIAPVVMRLIFRR